MNFFLGKQGIKGADKSISQYRSFCGDDMLLEKSSWNNDVWAAKSRYLAAISPSVLYQQSSVDPKMLSSTLFSQQHPIFIQ